MNSPQARPTYPLTRQAFSGFGTPKRKLLDRVRDVCRLRHYSLRTEQAYVYWIKKYILYFQKRHPLMMGKPEIEAFLTHLAVDQNCSASTQNQAFGALLFLYREALKKVVGDLGSYARAPKKLRIPVVLAREECRRLIVPLDGTSRLIAELAYDLGLRLTELLHLRIPMLSP